MALTTPANKGNAVPYYGGGQVPNPANVIQATIAPSNAATANAIGTIWINTTTGTGYLAVNNTGINGTVTWDQLGLATGTVGALSADVGIALPNLGFINIFGGTGISTSAAGNSVTINAIGEGLTTIVQTASPKNFLENERFVSNTGGLFTANLPATSIVGSVFKLTGLGAGGWLLQCGAGQIVNSSGGSTSSGGSIASTIRYDSVTIVCVVANTTFAIESLTGVLTIT